MTPLVPSVEGLELSGAGFTLARGVIKASFSLSIFEAFLLHPLAWVMAELLIKRLGYEYVSATWAYP